MYSPSHELIHFLTSSLIHKLIHELTHEFISLELTHEFIHGFNSGAYSWIHYLIHWWDHSLIHSLVHLHISQSLLSSFTSSFTHSWALALVDEGADKCAHESRTHKIGHLVMSSPTFSCICELAASPMNSLPHEHSQSWDRAHSLMSSRTLCKWAISLIHNLTYDWVNSLTDELIH